ncbi:MAG: Hfq-related RNA-binding protein [Cyanobacteriota bacterium]|jgi:host factor-I protein
MQSFFERRTPRLDTTLPGVRHIQDLVRQRTPVTLRLVDGSTLEGTIRWQDPELLALETGSDEPLVMVARAGLLTLRPLA